MDYIEFFFDGKLQKINFQDLAPTTTVLKYLRSLPQRQGTKEGCAEGDCGACTVVVAEPKNGRLVYRAVNSCLLFMPALHGKWLITVEDLGTIEQPHFIQQAFVSHFASQCGFCTPGFEMALLALIKENPNPTEQDINEAIEGNLCRCTGYRPIRDAAKTIAKVKQSDNLDQLEPTVLQALQSIKRDEPIILTYKDRFYAIPFTLEQALELRKEHPEAILVNGGTDIALKVTKLKQQLNSIIDLEHISELDFITHDDKWLNIGASTRIQDVKNYVKQVIPEFHELLSHFGAKQIRNRATMAGNIATSSPVGDLIPPLIAMNAQLVLANRNGSRTVPVEKFITGYRKNDLKPDELITQIQIPIHADYIYKFYKVSKRTSLDITTVSLAAALKINNQTIEDVRLVYGGMAETVRRATKAEQTLKGKAVTEQNFEQAANVVTTEFTPISDARADAEARSLLARNLIIKLFQDLVNDR